MSIGGRIILKWIVDKYNGVVWTAFIWPRIGTSKHGNELSGSIKCWEMF
jgi:hypothetical protein